MKMILVRGYKDAKYYPGDELREYARIPINSHHDAYVGQEIVGFIEKALSAENLTPDDVISMSVVPSPANGRDPGSNDYYLLCK
jgi:hypothetical protein